MYLTISFGLEQERIVRGGPVVVRAADDGSRRLHFAGPAIQNTTIVLMFTTVRRIL